MTAKYIYVVEWVGWASVEYVFRYATKTFITTPTSASMPLGNSLQINNGYYYTTNNGKQDVASIVIYDRIVGNPEFEVSRYDGTRTRGASGSDTAKVTLRNEDGSLDGLVGFASDGRPAWIWAINEDTLAVTPLWSGVVDSFDPGESTVTLNLRGYQSVLNQSMMPTKFAGSNSGAPLTGLEGTASDLKDKPKPFLLGSVYNIEPPIVNTGKLIYQLDGQMGQLFTGYTIAVYDKRSALASGGVYATLADLQNDAMAPAAGQFKVFPGPGGAYIRLGSTPTGRVTCDVSNPALYTGTFITALAFYAANYTTKLEAQWILANIFEWLNVNVMVSPYVHKWNPDLTNWDKLGYPTDQTAGVFFKEETTYRAAVDLLLGSIGACMTPGISASVSDVAGVRAIYVGLTQNSWSPSSTRTIAESDIKEKSFSMAKTGDPEGALPPKRYIIKYRKNFTPMDKTDLAGAVTESEAATVKEDYLKSSAVNGFAGQSLGAPDLELSTVLYTQTGADSLRTSIVAPFNTQGNMLVSVAMDLAQFIEEIMASPGASPYSQGLQVRPTYPRYGQDGGGAALLMRHRAQSDGTVNLTVLVNSFSAGSLAIEQ